MVVWLRCSNLRHVLVHRADQRVEVLCHRAYLLSDLAIVEDVEGGRIGIRPRIRARLAHPKRFMRASKLVMVILRESDILSADTRERFTSDAEVPQLPFLLVKRGQDRFPLL